MSRTKSVKPVICVLSVALLTSYFIFGADTALSQGRLASIRGTVTFHGTPASGVTVMARAGERIAGRAVTGDDGRFYIGKLSIGIVYSIKASLGAHTAVSGKIRLPIRRPINLTMQ